MANHQNTGHHCKILPDLVFLAADDRGFGNSKDFSVGSAVQSSVSVSGKLWKLTIFNSYVSLPEGIKFVKVSLEVCIFEWSSIIFFQALWNVMLRILKYPTSSENYPLVN